MFDATTLFPILNNNNNNNKKNTPTIQILSFNDVSGEGEISSHDITTNTAAATAERKRIIKNHFLQSQGFLEDKMSLEDEEKSLPLDVERRL